MARYSVISKGISMDEMQAAVQRYGGRNIKVVMSVQQIMCDLEPLGLAGLSAMPGLVVKTIGQVKAASLLEGKGNGTVKAKGIRTPVESEQAVIAQQPIYGLSQMQLASMYYQLRELTSPPTTGEELIFAVLDSGIRKTHRGLVGKVIVERNFTSSPTVSDVFSHGTGVAFCIAGGQHAVGQESGVLPGSKLWNVKVLDDDGTGTVENLIDGLDFVITEIRAAIDRGASPLECPVAINLSLGTEDDGDPDNPLRLACKAVTDAPDPYSISIFAAAGNGGPASGTIMLPASMREVGAIGSATFLPVQVWDKSSRGPAKDGTVKPDFLFYGVDIVTASASGDDAFEIKSGTSFSCPAGGCGGIGIELLLANLGLVPKETLGWVRHPPDSPYTTAIIKILCTKPSGYAMGVKDNDYGYGIPYGGNLIGALQGGSLTGMLTPMLSMVMVIPMMGMMSRMMK